MFLTESQLEIKNKCIFLNENPYWGTSGDNDYTSKSEFDSTTGELKAIIGKYNRSIQNINKEKFLKKVKENDKIFFIKNKNYKIKTTPISKNDYDDLNLLWKNSASGISNFFKILLWQKHAFFKIGGRFFCICYSSSILNYNNNKGNVMAVYILYEEKLTKKIKYTYLGLDNSYFINN